MKGVLALALLLLLAVLANSDAIREPVLVSSVNAKITKTGVVKAIGGTLSYVELNISMPSKTDWQTPSYAGQTVSDALGNSFIVLKKDNPGSSYQYSVESEVLTKARVTDLLPSSYVISDDLRVYTLPSAGIESNDAAIVALAKRITENSSNDFDKAARLAVWVHTNVDYDESLSGKEKSARWVLDNRRGVCAEFTSLFVAMARSVGIPTKYVSGYSYTTSKGWLGHAWAEVYLGRWVPVDPTWMEAGHLDATHIQMFSSYSRDAESSVFVYMSPGARVEWSGSGTLGSNVREVELQDQGSVPAGQDYVLKAGTGDLGFGGETVVYAKVKSKDYRVVDLTLATCVGSGSLKVDEPERHVILEPGRESVVVWKVSAPTSLQRGYIYKCPLTLNSAYLAESGVTISVFDGVPGVQMDSWLEKNSVPIGETQSVSFSSSSHPQGTEIYVATEDAIYSYRASSGTKSVEFSPKSLGPKRVWVFSSSGGVEELEYDVVAGGSLAIGELSVQEQVMEGETLDLSFSLASNSSLARRFRIDVGYEGEVRSSYVMLSGKQTFNYSFPDVKPGDGVITIKVEGAGETLERKISVLVLAKPTVVVQTSFAKGYDLTNVTFSSSKTGDARNVLIYIDGKVAPLSGGNGIVGIEPGTHRMKVVWQDAYGDLYSFEQELNVPKSGTVWEVTKTGSCPGFIVIFAVLLIATGRRIERDKKCGE